MNLQQHLMVAGAFDDGATPSTRETRLIQQALAKPIHQCATKKEEDVRNGPYIPGTLRNLRRH